MEGSNSRRNEYANEVKDLDRSGKLRDRAVADNLNEAGNKTIVTHISLRKFFAKLSRDS